MYNLSDYIRFLIHRGSRRVFWCGSDIQNLTLFWSRRLKNANHFCENEVEQRALRKMGLTAEITPMLFDDPADFPISYESDKNVHVYLTAHLGREREYGIPIVEEIARQLPDVIFHIYGIFDYSGAHNVIYHGRVPEEQFNAEIKNYHCALRLNQFDGASEIMVKSVLMGQYPISKIEYPYISAYKTQRRLIHLLRSLKERKEPNYTARNWWVEQIRKSLQTILDDE